MPIDAYYSGHGSEVMASMKDRYGDDKGERVFYATANKRKMKPKRAQRSRRPTTRDQARALKGGGDGR